MTIRSFATMIAAVALAAVAPAATKFTAPEGFKLQKDGTLIHKRSGTHFPIVYQGFARTTNFAFDPKGKDISVVYNAQLHGQPAEVRIAIVHILMMTAHEHYAGLSPTVGSYFQSMHFKTVRPAGDGPLQVPGIPADGAWQGRFRGVENGQPYLLSLTTVSFGYWSARITAAYPERYAADAQARITALIGEIRATGPNPK